MNVKKIMTGSVLGIGSVLATAVAVFAATVVTPTNNQGWQFNRDSANVTPYEFNDDEASIGVGSLFVKPIGVTAANKFIAEKTIGELVADVNSFSYDFLIAGDGTVNDADQFYLNVYTNSVESETFYDCRFDYVPTTGSITDFTTATFNATDSPTTVADRPGGIDCPATLAGMPAGSTVSFIALNVGDTSANDQGLAGYLDKVVVDLDGDITTYDFEPALKPGTDKNACKKGGWMSFNSPTFRNQGQCVSYVQSNDNAGKRN